MINVLIAVDKNYGIGKDGMLPWHISEELKLFKEKTKDCIVICGRKTFEKLPPLKDRIICVITKNIVDLLFTYKHSEVRMYSCVEDAIDTAQELKKKFFIIGGSQIYDYVFKNFKKELRLHISFINEEYECDTYFNEINLKDFYISFETKYDKFTHCEMIYKKFGEYQYLNLIEDILANGEKRVGRNGEVLSDFGKHLKFNLQDGFPLLTTKRMFLRGIVEELLFFIRGETDSKILEEKGVNIWKGNTSREFLDANGFKDRKEGEMGPIYSQLRHYNAIYNENMNIIKNYNYLDDKISNLLMPKFNIDQIQNVINEIKNNPTSRRLLMTTFNPSQVHLGVLFPCHGLTIQFYVQKGFLDMFYYCRSQDTVLGSPFNIASSSLLLLIIAKLTNLEARYLNLSLGDVHIYKQHEDCVKEQIKRIPYVFPKIILPEFKTLEEVEKFIHSDFKLENYNSYPSIKADMIA